MSGPSTTIAKSATRRQRSPRSRGGTLFALVLVTSLAACKNSDDGSRPSEWDDDNKSGIVTPDGDTSATGDSTGMETVVTPDFLRLVRLDPVDILIELDLGESRDMPYAANAHWSNGEIEDVTDKVTWTVDNPEVGSFKGATLEVPAYDKTIVHVSRLNAEIEQGGQTYTGHAQITVAAYKQSGNDLDFFFVLPWDDPTDDDPDENPKTKELKFATDVKALDVFFAMDTTRSMGGEIANLQDTLAGTVVSDIQDQIPNTHFGVGAIEDFPIEPDDLDWGYGDPDCDATGDPDQPFELLQTITGDIPDVQKAVNDLANEDGEPIGCGSDLPESIIEGIYQVATGEGLDGPGPTEVDDEEVGFRTDEGSMPVIVPITDAMSHAPGENDCGDWEPISYEDDDDVTEVAHDREETLDALDDICARVVTIASVLVDEDTGEEEDPDEKCSPITDGEEHAEETGARVPPTIWGEDRPDECDDDQCCTGIDGRGVEPDGDDLCPLVFRVSHLGDGLGESIVTGLKMLTLYAPFDVEVELTGETESVDGVPLPDGKTSADFITEILPTGWSDKPLDELPDPEMTDDGFLGVTPGTSVHFDVTGYNDWLLQTEDAQIFRAKIAIKAGHCIDLDERDVVILIPPEDFIPE